MNRRMLFRLGICILPFVGCTHVDYPEGAARGIRTTADVGVGHAQTLNAVLILDESLQVWEDQGKERGGKIAVEATNARRTPTNTVEAWAIFRNRTDFPLQLEARVSFFDETQAPLEGPSAWQRVFLPPNGSAEYRESSVDSTRVAHYRIEVREGR